MPYYATSNLRQQQVSPYIPDRTEKIGDNTKQAASVDINKAVKLDGDNVLLCADGDEIYGFIASVEAGSSDGHSVGGVCADVGREQVALDEAGGLTVGTRVVAGTAVAFGTAGGPNVKAAAGTEAGSHRWEVIGLENTPSQAGDEVLLRKV